MITTFTLGSSLFGFLRKFAGLMKRLINVSTQTF